jgi:DNA-binding CsgD family transcriptional regulator
MKSWHIGGSEEIRQTAYEERMDSLPRDHWLALLTTVAEIHGVRLFADFPRAVLRAVARLVPCDMASFNTVETSRRRMHSVAEPASVVASPATVEGLASLMHDHPLLAHHLASRDARPVMLSDLVTRRQFRDSALYWEFYRPIGIDHQMTVALTLGLDSSVGIALSRCGADFTEQERALLEILRPHLARAFATLGGEQEMARRRARAAVGSGRSPAAATTHWELTHREAEIMVLLAGGASNAELGDALRISPLTVKKHLEHIYQKLRVHRRGAAVACFRLSIESTADSLPNQY